MLEVTVHILATNQPCAHMQRYKEDKLLCSSEAAQLEIHISSNFYFSMLVFKILL